MRNPDTHRNKAYQYYIRKETESQISLTCLKSQDQKKSHTDTYHSNIKIVTFFIVDKKAKNFKVL